MDTAAVYTDFSGFTELRRGAREDSPAALRAAAQQFEAIFLQMVLSSMREAKLSEGLFNSSESKFYRQMFDQQVALSLSERGGFGLSDVLVRQLGGDASVGAQRPPLTVRAGAVRPGDVAPQPSRAPDSSTGGAKVGSKFETPVDFVRAIAGHAQRAAKELGVTPKVLIAQAALETGWGQHVMERSDGGSSHNLFGIKADHRWNGERVQASTLEYVNGFVRRSAASFRAYSGLKAGFDDYVQFLRGNPRYARALGESDPAEYARRLQEAGYATDPRYAEKIGRILKGDTLREAMDALNQ